MKQYTYIVLHKPYGVLCQFTSVAGKPNLSDVLPGIPKDVYSVGRLDEDSEGLLLLTNNKSVYHRVLGPKSAFTKIYYAQVEGIATGESMLRLRGGVDIKVDGKWYKTLPARAEILPHEPEWLEERTPPIRFRKDIPTTWVRLEIVEGKNRQVRKMTAAVGLPTLRLIRFGFGNLTLDGIRQGKYVQLSPKEVEVLLKIIRQT